ncbi:MAG: RecT family protein [Bacteriophage sp.]|nr:MAG: RecT family protein [Bacteriophage sp.]
MQEETTQQILDKVNCWQETGELILPKDYKVGNAIKLAWLYLQTVEDRSHRKAIDVCTKDSICNALLDMVLHGEYPKKHCYFIVYADRLEWNERYLGKYMRAKRDTEIEAVYPQVVYQGDEFVYTIDELGQYQLVKHVPNLDNLDITKIKAAYAIVVNKDKTRHMEIMTLDQIKKSWMQGAAKGTSGAHTNFTDQMCKKTVMARACKIALDSQADFSEDEDDNRRDEATAERDAAQQRQVAEAEAVEVHDEEAPKGIEAKTNYIDMNVSNQPEAIPAGSGEQPAASGRACPI